MLKRLSLIAAMVAISAAPAMAELIQQIDSSQISVSAMGWDDGGTFIDVGAEPRAVTPGSVYSNLNTLVAGFRPQSSTASGGTVTGRMLGDDINLSPVSAANVNQISATIYNNSATTVSLAARFRARFYAPNGSGGGPGTLLGGFDSTQNMASPGGFVITWTFNVASLALPSNFWAGLSFDNGGTGIADPFGGTPSPAGGNFPAATGVTTTAQMNALGQGLYNPPGLGTSANQDFLTTTTDPTGFNASNPTGSVRAAPFASPTQANYGWEFVPEPASLALLALGGLFVARRRRHA